MKKRILLTAVALILVCALSIMGTVAFLKDQTKEVVNTFVAAGGPGPFVDEVDGVKQFDLKEYEVTQATSGKYTLNNQKEVAANDYKVLPNTTIPKQAFVKLSRTGKTVMVDNETTTYTPAPAYLYLEVVDGLNAEHYTWSVNSDWEKLGTVTVEGKTSDIYLYVGALADDTHVLTTVTAGTKIDIITENKVTAKNVVLPEGEFTITFNAYLAQASTGETDDPTAVFNDCFGKTITPVAAPDPDPAG